jgi:hypothetical protein
MEVRFFIPILAARELVFATITINKLAVMSLTTFPGAISILSKVSLFYGPSFCPLAKWINLNFDAVQIDPRWGVLKWRHQQIFEKHQIINKNK